MFCVVSYFSVIKNKEFKCDKKTSFKEQFLQVSLAYFSQYFNKFKQLYLLI